MRVQNKIDRYNLVLLCLKHLKLDKATKNKITDDMNALLKKHSQYIKEFGEDMPEVKDWHW